MLLLLVKYPAYGQGTCCTGTASFLFPRLPI